MTLKQKLWRTHAGHLVPDGHPDAAFLYGVPGNRISMAEARKHGLVEEEQPEVKEVKPAETKETKPAETKEVKPEETKKGKAR